MKKKTKPVHKPLSTPLPTELLDSVRGGARGGRGDDDDTGPIVIIGRDGP